jgi:hypothetical protein
MRISAVFCPAALALPAFMALGCGGGPAVAPVSGTVTMDGKPLANAAVNFQPKASGRDVNPGPGSAGMTDAQGNFTLQVVGTAQNGAVVGRHRVEISAYVRGPGSDSNGDRREPAPRNLVPAKYNDHTTLEFDVPAGGTQAARFDLTSR